MSRPPASYPADIRDTFEYCEGCQSLVVSVDQHTCPKGGSSGKPTAAERAQLAAEDDRPLDEDVRVPEGRSQNNAWAYHEFDEDGDPLHSLNYNAGSETKSREEAINDGCYPCGHCRVIQERGEDDG